MTVGGFPLPIVAVFAAAASLVLAGAAAAAFDRRRRHREICGTCGRPEAIRNSCWCSSPR